MKRRLVLHLGLLKTGTTTLQSFLRDNPELLADIGVHYPKVGPENPDHPFFRPKPPTAFLAEEVSHRFLAQELIVRRRGPPEHMPLWSTAFRLFENSGAHTAIISYENLSAEVSHYQFDAVAERLKSFDVIGVIYLRPQESWAVSLYSHFVRDGRTSLSFAEYVESIRHRLTYSVMLDRIRDQIPLDSLIVRNFDTASKTGLIEDFFRSLDLPDPLSALPTDYRIRNRSLPHWAVIFLLRCIQASFPTESLTDVRKALIRRAASRRPLPLRPGLDLATPEERIGLRAVMSADARRLAENYGFAFAEAQPSTAPYRPFDKDDFRAIKKMIAPGLGARTLTALDDL